MNLAIAIDFSQPHTHVDEMSVRQFIDDVNLAIRAVGEPLKEFNMYET